MHEPVDNLLASIRLEAYANNIDPVWHGTTSGRPSIPHKVRSAHFSTGILQLGNLPTRQNTAKQALSQGCVKNGLVIILYSHSLEPAPGRRLYGRRESRLTLDKISDRWSELPVRNCVVSLVKAKYLAADHLS